MGNPAVVDAVLGVNYLMRVPLTRDEVERVLHAVALANYEVRPLPIATAVRPRRKASARG